MRHGKALKVPKQLPISYVTTGKSGSIWVSLPAQEWLKAGGQAFTTEAMGWAFSPPSSAIELLASLMQALATKVKLNGAPTSYQSPAKLETNGSALAGKAAFISRCRVVVANCCIGRNRSRPAVVRVGRLSFHAGAGRRSAGRWLGGG